MSRIQLRSSLIYQQNQTTRKQNNQIIKWKISYTRRIAWKKNEKHQFFVCIQSSNGFAYICDSHSAIPVRIPCSDNNNNVCAFRWILSLTYAFTCLFVCVCMIKYKCGSMKRCEGDRKRVAQRERKLKPHITTSN